MVGERRHKEVIHARGDAALPEHADDMIRVHLSAHAPLPAPLRDRPVMAAALRRVRSTRPPGPASLIPALVASAGQPARRQAVEHLSWMMEHPMQQRWPGHLWIVRHGESAGNVARDAAMTAGLPRIDLNIRDVDVPLSPRGERQADALGRWFAAMPRDQQPEAVLVSPYLRARDTAARIHAEGGTPVAPARFAIDERLREKEFGVLDLLTRMGIETEFPDQARFRTLLGKFYHRPPGGESWCDVILRLRSLLDTLLLHHEGRRVLIVAHQVVVLCLRYLLENMDEAQILAVDREGDVANCGVTEYAPGAGGLQLLRYNHTVPVEREGEQVTDAPDSPVAAR